MNGPDPGGPRKFSRRAVVLGMAAGVGALVLGGLGLRPVRRPLRRPPADWTQLDLQEAARAVREREVSPVELTQASLERIRLVDPKLNAYITVVAERALADARAAEAEIGRGGWRGPLHGIPIGLKDNIDTAGIRTTAASRVFAERVPAADADLVRLLKAAGAIVLGKHNLHEFALGTTSAISSAGAVHNPWDPDRVTGGSSGGSGAAVAAGLCFGAVGTDTGGSIRIPAACCGIVGLKPTYGVVSTRGTIPISKSFDHAGPMGRTVADTALLFRAMTDHPVAREFAAESPPPVRGLRVGVLRRGTPLCDRPVDSEVEAAFEAAVQVIRELVADVRAAELPMPEHLGALIDAEAYAYHAPYLGTVPGLYDPRTLTTISAGRDVGEAARVRASRELAQHRETIVRSFTDLDLVLLPTLPVLPIPLIEATDPFALDACTFAFSLGGLPSLSLPCGFSKSGLPIGLLISGPPLSEPRILALAAAYERVAGWHRHRPPV